jgi:hypothetical protein
MGKRGPEIPVRKPLEGKVGDRMPRDERKLLPCAWCGGRIDQPPIGRLRDYCRRTCREFAYRERKTQQRIADAVAADRER